MVSVVSVDETAVNPVVLLKVTRLSFLPFDFETFLWFRFPVEFVPMWLFFVFFLLGIVEVFISMVRNVPSVIEHSRPFQLQILILPHSF